MRSVSSLGTSGAEAQVSGSLCEKLWQCAALKTRRAKYRTIGVRGLSVDATIGRCLPQTR
jgi:hypothetical protein